MTSVWCLARQVVDEVRDSQSRRVLDTLPFGIDIREPDEESYAAVKCASSRTVPGVLWHLKSPRPPKSQESSPSSSCHRRFARQTGDITVLSTVDMKVIALAFMLEKAAHGV